MKIVNGYINLKNQHASFFSNYDSKERIKHKEKIFDLKKQCDSYEISIVKSIINYVIDYERCFELLKKNDMHHFLLDNVAISRFMIKQSISKTLGIDEMERHKELDEFEKMCFKAWDDYIITKEEREELNNYCKDHLIDHTLQYNIESKVREQINHSEIDLEKVIYYYAFQEYLAPEEIQELIKIEYQKDISIKRINHLIQLNDSIDDSLSLKEGESSVVREIKMNEDVSLHLIVVKNELSSNLEFEIGFPKRNVVSVIITEKTYNNSEKNRLIDIATDGFCYNTFTTLSEFLQHKPLIREVIEENF